MLFACLTAWLPLYHLLLPADLDPDHFAVAYKLSNALVGLRAGNDLCALCFCMNRIIDIDVDWYCSNVSEAM
jgi:hypothetical protein